MTVLVGYLAGKCDPAALNLAGQLAGSLQVALQVITVVPRPWGIPSLAKVDAEFSDYANKLAKESKSQGQGHLQGLAGKVAVDYAQVAARSPGDGLLEAAERSQADLIVVGSSSEAEPGRLLLGSTSDWLVHSSPIPVAIAPQGYHRPPTAQPSRVTCAYSGTKESAAVVRRAAKFARRLGVSLRVVSFAIRGRVMYPPELGLNTETTLQQAWLEQLQKDHTKLHSEAALAGAEFLTIAAKDWAEGVSLAPWQEDELLLLGPTSRRSIKGVFLGSRSAKIIKYSPVPVLLLPS